MFGMFAPRMPQIAVQDLEVRLPTEAAPFVLDVREASEYAQGHIPGSRHIPLGTLGSRLEDLPRDREIVVVCLSGGRSSAATRDLIQAGFQAVNMMGGMMAWRGPVER